MKFTNLRIEKNIRFLFLGFMIISTSGYLLGSVTDVDIDEYLGVPDSDEFMNNTSSGGDPDRIIIALGKNPENYKESGLLYKSWSPSQEDDNTIDINVIREKGYLYNTYKKRSVEEQQILLAGYVKAIINKYQDPSNPKQALEDLKKDIKALDDRIKTEVQSVKLQKKLTEFRDLAIKAANIMYYNMLSKEAYFYIHAIYVKSKKPFTIEQALDDIKAQLKISDTNFPEDLKNEILKILNIIEAKLRTLKEHYDIDGLEKLIDNNLQKIANDKNEKNKIKLEKENKINTYALEFLKIERHEQETDEQYLDDVKKVTIGEALINHNPDRALELVKDLLRNVEREKRFHIGVASPSSIMRPLDKKIRLLNKLIEEIEDNKKELIKHKKIVDENVTRILKMFNKDLKRSIAYAKTKVTDKDALYLNKDRDTLTELEKMLAEKQNQTVFNKISSSVTDFVYNNHKADLADEPSFTNNSSNSENSSTLSGQFNSQLSTLGLSFDQLPAAKQMELKSLLEQAAQDLDNVMKDQKLSAVEKEAARKDISRGMLETMALMLAGNKIGVSAAALKSKDPYLFSLSALTGGAV